ncbi:tetratricopeptide repeat protein [Vibrio splendidus]
MTLNGLGILHRLEKRIAAAFEANKEALGIYRELAKTSPAIYSSDVALTLNNLGNLHRDDNCKEEALKAYKEARDIYERNMPHTAAILDRRIGDILKENIKTIRM